MLCLTNGQRIKVKPSLKFLFEVDHLDFVSPATVSRCGMVYLDKNVTNIASLIHRFYVDFTKETIIKHDLTIGSLFFVIKNLEKKIEDLVTELFSTLE